MHLERLTNTIIEILRIPSTSGHEEPGAYIFRQQLSHLKIPFSADGAGIYLSQR